ncbi:MAG TPA: TetR/AcrR family transcriptional regulator [Candidatus Bathyarchaeia archaeon]|nr:TetR/AcrR family transcriptional regulator [Candidatus Bathyarchaeia archaeon]
MADRPTARSQRRPTEKRARLLAAGRAAFSQTGYAASVHEICRAAGVGIGTFYQQFPDKSDLMRFLMDDEHQYRVSAFDALAAKPAGDLASEVSRVLAGSDPALLRAMVEGCETDGRLRDFGRDLRKETHERLVAALSRVRESRKTRRPALDARTASWAMLLLGDAAVDPAASDDLRKVIDILAFAGDDTVEQARA